jgi:hypothetical protein
MVGELVAASVPLSILLFMVTIGMVLVLERDSIQSDSLGTPQGVPTGIYQ